MEFIIALSDLIIEGFESPEALAQHPNVQEIVHQFYLDQFAGLPGMVTVAVVGDVVHVYWDQASDSQRLLDEAVDRLNAGELAAGINRLRAYTALVPKDAIALYNLGMALSDSGMFEDAQTYLLRANRLAPDSANTIVALGVALYRSGNSEAAQRRFDQALVIDPNNGYAHRNLAAILATSGRHDESIDHFRRAHELLPNDPQSAYGLAKALLSFGPESEHATADSLLISVIDSHPESDIAEQAKQLRSQLAQSSMRERGGDLRFDAVMYCLSALQKFAAMEPKQVQAIAYEIAMAGRSGIDVNSPEKKYRLNSLSGSYSGMQLMCLMYVAFAQIAPDADIGFDLKAEYTAALNMFMPEG